jgi:hypothetical protein
MLPWQSRSSLDAGKNYKQLELVLAILSRLRVGPKYSMRVRNRMTLPSPCPEVSLEVDARGASVLFSHPFTTLKSSSPNP